MRALIQLLSTYAVRFLPLYVLGFIALSITNWATVHIPTLIGEVVNALNGDLDQAARFARARTLTVQVAAWSVLLVVVRTLSRTLFFNPGRDIEYQLGNDLFRVMLGLQRSFFANRKVGELVSIATNDMQSVRLLVGFAGLQIFNVAVAVPLHIGQMYALDPVLTAWCALPVLGGGAFMAWTVRRFYLRVRLSLELLASLSECTLESYAGVGTLRSNCAEEVAEVRFHQRNQTYLALQLEISKIRAFAMPVLGFSGIFATGIVLWIGGERVIAGQLQVGDLTAFSVLLTNMAMLLLSLAWVLTAISRGLVALKRIRGIQDVDSGVPSAQHARRFTTPPRIEIRSLTFAYPNTTTPAIEGLDVSVAPGATLGIFGRTGAGKTTLIELLARVHDLPPGAITFDGEDARSFDLAAMREKMAVVPQTPFLFSTTLRDNIRLRGEISGHRLTSDAREDKVGRLVRRGATDEEVFLKEAELAGADRNLVRVIEQASLADDIALLPDGLDTIVGERGVMLSGGQRQRAALARALYRSPSLLMLDDVLSAVDQRTEAKLVEAIRTLGSDGERPTTLIVSHRTSALEHADEILVLAQGRVIERGTHEQLVELGGEYAQAVLHQSKSREAETDEEEGT